MYLRYSLSTIKETEFTSIILKVAAEVSEVDLSKLNLSAVVVTERD